MVVQRRMLRQLVSLACIVARGFNGHFAPRNFKPLTSALGHKRAFSEACMMSALPPKADIAGRGWRIPFVPILLQKSLNVGR